MNNKSRGVRGACGASTLAGLSDNKFLKDYWHIAKRYLYDNLPDEISIVPSVDELMDMAEEAFINHYNMFPTCAVVAPGSLNLAGKAVNHVESKSLCMAVQLVTLIVGKSSSSCKWCQVKILSDGNAGETAYKFYMNAESLDFSTEGNRFLRYLKATMHSFRSRAAHVPGFEMVIMSTVPLERGLGYSSALVVALYTFLEAITHTYTGNVFEKTLACYLAEKLAAGSFPVRVADTLASVVGREGKVFSFDAGSLVNDPCDWNTVDNELILITNANDDNVEDPSNSKLNLSRNKDTLTILNTMSRWRTYPGGGALMKSLFSQEARNITDSVVEKDESVCKMTDAVRREQWEVLGKLLWENYRTARKYLTSLPDETQRIMNVLETTEGVLGASIVSHGYNPSIIALVQRSRLKSFIYSLNSMKISQRRYYLIKSFTGSSILYTHENFHPWHYRQHTKLIIKYHIRNEDTSEKFDDPRSLSLFIPQQRSFH